MINYRFMTIKELADEIDKKYKIDGRPIGFTLDSPDDVTDEDWDPSYWYGAKKNK